MQLSVSSTSLPKETGDPGLTLDEYQLNADATVTKPFSSKLLFVSYV